jgi:hypothetical protein
MREHFIPIFIYTCQLIFISSRGKIFLFFTTSRPTLRPNHPPSQWPLELLSPEIKRNERDADHSPPSSVKVENCGAIPPLLPMSSWCAA